MSLASGRVRRPPTRAKRSRCPRTSRKPCAVWSITSLSCLTCLPTLPSRWALPSRLPKPASKSRRCDREGESDRRGTPRSRRARLPARGSIVMKTLCPGVLRDRSGLRRSRGMRLVVRHRSTRAHLVHVQSRRKGLRRRPPREPAARAPATVQARGRIDHLQRRTPFGRGVRRLRSKILSRGATPL